MIITSFKNSACLFATELKGTAPMIITAVMIIIALRKIWKIRKSLKMTTITAIKNLRIKKYSGCMSEILPSLILKSSKILSNRVRSWSNPT